MIARALSVMMLSVVVVITSGCDDASPPPSEQAKVDSAAAPESTPESPASPESAAPPTALQADAHDGSTKFDDPDLRRMRTLEQFRADLLAEFDLSDARIDVEKLHVPGVPRDGIESLQMPLRVQAADAAFPYDYSRVAVVEEGGVSVAYPLLMLTFHEVANDVVGDVPVAVTYSPLSNSVAIFDRRVDDGTTLEFGISGMLWNSSNVLYDRQEMAIWQQLGVEAISGRRSGWRPKHRPVQVVSFGAFKEAHPDGQVLSPDNGTGRDYRTDPYWDYFASDLVMYAFDYGDALPRRTLGAGIRAGDFTTFVTAAAAAGQPVVVETPMGPVTVESSDAGISVSDVPPGVDTVQSFYVNWSAMYPGTEVVEEGTEAGTH